MIHPQPRYQLKSESAQFERTEGKALKKEKEGTRKKVRNGKERKGQGKGK